MTEKRSKPKTYWKTINILKNYNKINKSLLFLEDKLKGLEEEKSLLPKSIVKSNRVHLVEDNQNYYYTDETLENDINETKQMIVKVKKQLDFIDSCINELEKEQQEIVNLHYKRKESVTSIIRRMSISEKTFYNIRKKIIYNLSYLLFANTKINEEYQELEETSTN